MAATIEGTTSVSSRVKYINQKIQPLLTEMSLILLKQQPDDPESFVFSWLQSRMGKGSGYIRSKLASAFDQALVSGEMDNAIAVVSEGDATSPTKLEVDMASDAVLVALGCKTEEPVSALELATTRSNISIDAQLKDPGFDCLSRRNPQADAGLVVKAFAQPYDLVEKFQIKEEILETFAMDVALKSPQNPFHNWSRAMDVLQFCHLSLASGIGALLTFSDILSLLSSAIAISLGHPGTTNAFLVDISGEIAMRYNDRFPVQNCCAHSFFELLQQPAMNYTNNMPKIEFKAFRWKVIQLVLSTDMSQHFPLVDKFSSYMSSRDSKSRSDSTEDRLLLSQVVSHTSSLAYSCRPWNVHKLLVQALEEEFFSQGELEKAAGLPVSPLMDSSKDSLAAAQGFFLQKLISPLFVPYCKILSSDVAVALGGYLKENQTCWQQLLKQHGHQSAANLIGAAKEDAIEHDW